MNYSRVVLINHTSQNSICSNKKEPKHCPYGSIDATVELLLETLLRLQPAGKEMFLEYREFDINISSSKHSQPSSLFGVHLVVKTYCFQKKHRIYIDVLAIYHVLSCVITCYSMNSSWPLPIQIFPLRNDQNHHRITETILPRAFCNGPPGKSPPIASGSGEISEQRCSRHGHS